MDDKSLILLSIDGKNLTSDLERAGYRKMGVDFKSTASFREADDYLQTNRVDIITINFDYEGVDAAQLCKHFKRQEKTKDIPVVFTSVLSQPRGANAKDIGLDLFVELPVPRQYFIERIRSLLAQKTRGTDRVSFTSPAQFSFKGETVNCPIADLSNSGVLLSTDLNLANDTEIYLSFMVPCYKKPIKIKGIVARTIYDDSATKVQIGIGIRFSEFIGDSKRRLEKYISKSQYEDPKLAYYL